MNNAMEIMSQVKSGDRKALARAVTVVENELEGYHEILYSLDHRGNVPVIGITGPPGAGKSTLISAMLDVMAANGKKIAVLAIDPTSPFNYGSLLGDRLRMSGHFNNPSVYIRSIATRGALGGLSEKTIEITDLLKNAGFDSVFIETVGVGQSEVEISGLADTTLVVLVPEAGDEVQTMKSGIMEIADIFVVNKADREGADLFSGNLEKLVESHALTGWKIPVIKATATTGKGVLEIIDTLDKHARSAAINEKKSYLLAEKVFRLIQRDRMKDINKQALAQTINKEILVPEFNIYKFAAAYRDGR